MKKIFTVCICCVALFLVGCSSVQYVPAELEVDSADVANQIRVVRSEFKIYADAAKAAATNADDKNTLDLLSKIIDKDLSDAHDRSIKLHDDIKTERNK